MILMLRGHIRESFNSNTLYNFVKELSNLFPDLNIYIHTWNIFANNLSWRKIENNNNIVDDNIIFNYFNDLKHLIKKIIIDDDSKIELIGNLNGNVGLSTMPLKGWKNYWYGKYNIINYIYNTDIDKNEFVINTRFDLFYNSHNFNYLQIINFIKNNNKNLFTENKFLINKYQHGIDNIYIGNINTIYKLIHKFYYELDNILIEHIDYSLNQEKLVFLLNYKLFNDKLFNDKLFNDKLFNNKLFNDKLIYEQIMYNKLIYNNSQYKLLLNQNYRKLSYKKK